MAEEELKEIQLVDPLYEPVIMYPIKKMPICDECLKVYQKYYMEFSNHYQKLVRTQWKEKIDRHKQRFEAENIDFDKHLERELRLKVQKSDNAYKDLKELIIRSRNMERDKECGYVEYESAKYEHPRSCKYKHPSFDYEHFNSATALKELYDLYNELINTFEMQRLMHLQMTGFLSLKYPSSTHTRFAHVIGTWISGLIALQNVTVVTKEGEKRLIEFLADEDMHREFMAALILHDIGHAPFSHVLEMNPHLRYNHEEITEEEIKGADSYLELEDLLVSSYVDLEFGYDEIYGIIPGILDKVHDKIRIKEKFVLVHDVIASMGLDEEIIIELFSDEYSKDPAVRALRGLVHGVIDIDRIDHIYRDLHYNCFKTMGIPLTSLFHGIKIYYGEKPYMKVSEEITPLIEILLEARELSNKAIFDNPVNNFYIGVLNAAISDGVIMMPLLKYYIPYLTDEALLHVLINRDLFHNLSPSRKIGIITGSSFGHQDYRYSSYLIRKWDIARGDGTEKKVKKEMPDKKLKPDILKCISELPKEEDVIWHVFLKDVRRDYGLEVKHYPTPEELDIEKLNEDEGKFKWLVASILIAEGKETEGIKDVLKGTKGNESVENVKRNIKKQTEKEDVEGLKVIFEKAKDGKELKKEINKLIGEEASGIFFKGFSTNVYIGKEKKPRNKLEEKLKKYIEGITWDGEKKRSWTFTLFEKKNESKIDKIEEKLKNGIIWIAEEERFVSPIFENNVEIKNELEKDKNIAFIFFDNTEEDEKEKAKEKQKVMDKIKNIAPSPSDVKLHVFVIEKIVNKDRV